MQELMTQETFYALFVHLGMDSDVSLQFQFFNRCLIIVNIIVGR